MRETACHDIALLTYMKIVLLNKQINNQNDCKQAVNIEKLN